ncbi:MAG TPA: efflux RND transporter periplasmic adaptor subunit [Thermoanaerobaculia bacterium]|nr:efflux RND transporter periplasmic adaptor subunit [Thermoanaerobaculia bacterium]HQR66665.1 efflux RND transporter periplasmic adaptor subunit [Thermoanaerobaculia bacterium]
MKQKRLLALVLAAAVSAAAAGSALVSSGCRKAGGPAAAVRRYHCPMHPEVVKDGPGDCPICGMKLVPIEDTAAPPASGAPELAPVEIDAAKRQLLGLRTTVVKRAPFETSIRTTGRIAADERRVHHVHTRYEGFVEHVTADFTGKYVTKGEVLAHLYSPELYATQEEYLLALKASRSLGPSAVPSVADGGRDLLAAARQRLLLWEIAPSDIAEIEKRGEPIRAMPVYAPISGYVTGRMAYHGMKVTSADTLFDILDLSRVWLLADVYEYELPRLSLGGKATMTLSYWPGRVWNGTVTYVYPAVDEKTRTVKVRVELDNPKGELKPEMFADVTLHSRPRVALQVPDDAVLESGTRNIVFVSEGEGRLAPREVSVGDHGVGVVEIRDGLKEGEVVALGANFLVDSESRLKASIGAMGGAK